jgi:hypothetical protein
MRKLKPAVRFHHRGGNIRKQEDGLDGNNQNRQPFSAKKILGGQISEKFFFIVFLDLNFQNKRYFHGADPDSVPCSSKWHNQPTDKIIIIADCAFFNTAPLAF